MERVVFNVVSNDDYIPCLLNPESLLLQRQAGVSTKTIHGGLLRGSDLADDPLLFTGGGRTELTLNLLFDVNIYEARESEIKDVRELTSPLWALTENLSLGQRKKCPELVRLIWGKAFKFTGVITDIAERLEYFTADGFPQRSFLRLKMYRVIDFSDDIFGGAMVPPPMPENWDEEPPTLIDETQTHSVMGASSGSESGSGEAERIDQLAFHYYGDPTQWRLLAWINDLDSPEMIEAGTVLHVPQQGDLRL